MKSLSRTYILLMCLVATALGQPSDGYGFLNITNVIPGNNTCKIVIGGEEVAPDGLKGGHYTGWFMVKTGTKTISISHSAEGINTASGSLQIVEGLGNLVAIYLEPDPRPDTSERNHPPKLRIKSFPTYESNDYGLKFISLFPGEDRIHLSSVKIEPKQFIPLEIPNWNGGGFEMKRNGISIGNIATRTEAGAFYLLIGNDAKDNYTSVLVSANQQEVPEYLKSEKNKKQPAASLVEPSTQP